VTVMTAVSTADQMLVLLADVALKAHQAGQQVEPGHLAWQVVRQHADASHTDETLLLAWTDFADQVVDRAALDSGTRHWRDLFDPEDCAGFDHAIDMLSGRIDDAYRVIRDGAR